MSRPPFVVIARREFIERVRSVWFAVVTVLGPVAMVAILVIPAWLQYRSAEETVAVAVVDRSDVGLGGVLKLIATNPLLKDQLSIALAIEELSPTVDEAALIESVRLDLRDGFLVVPADVLSGGEVVYKGDNATNIRLVATLRQAVVTAVSMHRAEKAGLDATQVAELLTPPNFRADPATAGAGVSGPAALILGYAAMFIIYMAIILYAVNVLRSVVQEKTNRVVEIIVSSTRPTSLMLGKILGVGAVGLFQLSVWGLFAVLMIHYREAVLGVFGIHGAGSFRLPELNGTTLAVILAYFLLGYFFYAALYAAIGAMVENDQEAQQLQTPVMLLLVIPVACVQLIANDPRSEVAGLLTMIPFSSPVLMPMRYVMGGAGGGDIALSLAILAASMVGVVWISARIYRVGILMHGKRPSLGEVLRWIRY